MLTGKRKKAQLSSSSSPEIDQKKTKQTDFSEENPFFILAEKDEMASSEESSVAQVRDTLQNKLSEFISAELEKMKVGLHSLIREAIEEETEKLNDRM